MTSGKRLPDDTARALREFEMLFEAASDPVCFLDVDQRIRRCNAVSERFFGRPRSELIGRHCWEILHGTDGPVAGCPVQSARRSLQRETMEFPMDDRSFLVVVDPIIDDAGGYAGAMHIVTDVTAAKRSVHAEQQKAHRRQREAETVARLAMSPLLARGAVEELAAELTEQAASVLEVERVGVWLFDESETRLVAVDNYLRSTGRHSSGAVLLEDEFRNEFLALKNARYVDAHDPLTDPRTSGYVESYLKPNRITSMLDAVIRAEGRNLGALCFEHVDRPHRWQDDEIAFACQLADQISLAIVHRESKKREEATERLREQLTQAQKMESVGRLAGGVAHDFNNLLSIILGYADVVTKKLKPGDSALEHVRQIQEAGQRAVALTRQLLAFSRRQPRHLDVIVLNAVVAGLTDMLRRMLGEDIALRLCLSENPIAVKADRSQIEQMIMNLAVNARDAMPRGGILTIETRDAEIGQGHAGMDAGVPPGQYAMLAVTDTGCGMDKETMSRVFEPFFTTKDRQESTGLGLSTVYGIVKQSGGEILVDSEPGRGTRFEIYLPITDETPVEKKPAETIALRGNGESILLVEDEAALCRLLERLLVDLGYKVETAANSAEAIELVERGVLVPDLLLTDVVLPGMNGADLSRRLLQTLPRMKTLFMSGYADNAVVNHGVQDRTAVLLQKPIDKNELASKLAEALASRKE